MTRLQCHFCLSIRDFHSGFCQLPYAMENVTTSSATVPDGIRIGVCGLVGALYLSASIVTVTFNGLLLYVMFKDPLKCFRRPFAVYVTGLAMTDFLFGAVLGPLSARIEFYCVKDKDGETTFYHIIDILSITLLPCWYLPCQLAGFLLSIFQFFTAQGHPTTIFGRISVRKTILDLEFSKHLL